MWKKNERSVSDARLSGPISEFLRNSLMAHGLLVRTGVGANRSATAKRRAFRDLSAGISTGFSAAVSENRLDPLFCEGFPETARRTYPRDGGS
jgi:hypothetical protein